jgi:hypothetical protein
VVPSKTARDAVTKYEFALIATNRRVARRFSAIEFLVRAACALPG